MGHPEGQTIRPGPGHRRGGGQPGPLHGQTFIGPPEESQPEDPQPEDPQAEKPEDRASDR